MKVAGNGQGKILDSAELRLLFSEGFVSPRDRALFGICLFTGCRVSEALALQTTDIQGEALTFRKSTTKGKLKTRVVDIQPDWLFWGMSFTSVENFWKNFSE
jgi:integrase/recombinase XerD